MNGKQHLSAIVNALSGKKTLVCFNIFLFVLFCGLMLVQRQDKMPLNEVLGTLGVSAVISDLYHGKKGLVAYPNIAYGVFYNELNKSRQTGEAISWDEAIKLAIDARPESDWVIYPNTTLCGATPAYMLFVKAAFKIFGPSTRSLLLSLLLLMFASLSLFLLQFRDQKHLLISAFMFLGLALFWLYSGETERNGMQRIYDIRAWSLLSYIPALHILLSLVLKDQRISAACLAVQISIYMLSGEIRANGRAFSLAILCLVLIYAFMQRKDGAALRRIGKSILKAAALFVVVWCSFQAIKYFQLDPGHKKFIGAQVWHRAYISAGLHPDFPFRQYDADEYPLIKGLLDVNGFNVWRAERKRQGLFHSFGDDALYRGTYEHEKIMRNAFFSEVRQFPKKYAELFFYYKPKHIYHANADMFKKIMDGLWRPTGFISWAYFLSSLAAVFLAALAIGKGPPQKNPGSQEPGPGFFSRGLGILLCSLAFLGVTVLPFMVAWCGSSHSMDFQVCLFTFLGLALSYLIAAGLNLAAKKAGFARVGDLS